MNSKILFGLIGLLLIVGGVAFLLNSNTGKTSSSSETVQMQDVSVQVQPANEQTDEGKIGKQPLDDLAKEEMEKAVDSGAVYSGNILAGSASFYLEFNQADYEKALTDGKIIFLDFYANWCPICRGEAPGTLGVFNDLDSSNVVGFRVNYEDSDTDADENALAEKFSAINQHQKVILVEGSPVLSEADVWGTAKLLAEINKALGQ